MKTDKVQRIFPTSLSKLGSTSLFHPETRKNPLQGTGQRGIPERRRAVPSSRSTSCESAVRGPAQGPPLPFPADRQARMRLHCHLRLQRGTDLMFWSVREEEWRPGQRASAWLLPYSSRPDLPAGAAAARTNTLFSPSNSGRGPGWRRNVRCKAYSDSDFSPVPNWNIPRMPPEITTLSFWNKVI